MIDENVGKPNLIDPILLTDNYLDENDWRTKENSNSSFSIGGLILHQAGAISASYWLNKVYSHDIAEAHKNCDFHIHDLSFLGGYCFEKEKRFILANGENLSFEEAEQRMITEADVLSINNSGQLEPKHATNIGKKGIDDLYQFELEDGTIVKGFTRWHEFKTKNRGFVRADELTEEDELIEYHEIKDISFF